MDLVTAMATSEIRGFMLNIRSMFVATFLLLLFWILLLLTKYIVNAIRPITRSATMYDTYSGRGSGVAINGGTTTGSKYSKWMPRWTPGPMFLPPPPPPTIPGTAFAGAGGMTNGAGPGAGAGREAMNAGAGGGMMNGGAAGMTGEAADKGIHFSRKIFP